MLVNSDCTIFHRVRDAEANQDTWKRQYVKECWWFEDTKSAATTDGLKSADVLKVRIPDLRVVVKKDDYILRGMCQVNMSTIKDLAGHDYFKVVSANYNTFGDEPHIKVVGA